MMREECGGNFEGVMLMAVRFDGGGAWPGGEVGSVGVAEGLGQSIGAGSGRRGWWEGLEEGGTRKMAVREKKERS